MPVNVLYRECIILFLLNITCIMIFWLKIGGFALLDRKNALASFAMASPRSPGSSVQEYVQAAVQHVYKFPKCSKHTYSVVAESGRRLRGAAS